MGNEDMDDPCLASIPSTDQVIFPNLGERVFHLDLLLNSAFVSDSFLACR